MEDENAFLEITPAHMGLSLLLAVWTGQRQGDLLRLTGHSLNDVRDILNRH